MTPEKVVQVIEMYEERLSAEGIPKKRMDPRRTFGSLSAEEALAHAHYLCSGVKKYAQDPNRQRKTGSHLTSVQLCLSLANWYTLSELMDHNRPSSEA